MSGTLFSRFFSILSSQSGHEERHLRLRRFRPLVERMEERALLAGLVASLDGLKDKATPAIVAGAAGSKATTTQVKGDLAIGGTKGDGAGAAKAAGTIKEAKQDAKVAVDVAADVKSAAAAIDLKSKDAQSITSTLSGAGSGLNKDEGAKFAPVTSAAGASEAKSQLKDGMKADGAATSAVGAAAAKGSSTKDGASDGTQSDTAASGIAKSGSPSGESKSAASLSGIKSSVKSDKTELSGGTILNQLTAEATDAALLEVLTSLQLPAVQASR